MLCMRDNNNIRNKIKELYMIAGVEITGIEIAIHSFVVLYTVLYMAVFFNRRY